MFLTAYVVFLMAYVAFLSEVFYQFLQKVNTFNFVLQIFWGRTWKRICEWAPVVLFFATEIHRGIRRDSQMVSISELANVLISGYANGHLWCLFFTTEIHRGIRRDSLSNQVSGNKNAKYSTSVSIISKYYYSNNYLCISGNDLDINFFLVYLEM